MRRQKLQMREAELLAETLDGGGIALVVDGTTRPVGGQPREVVVYTAVSLDVPHVRIVSRLRELADAIESSF